MLPLANSLQVLHDISTLENFCKKNSKLGIELGLENIYTLLFSDDQVILTGLNIFSTRWGNLCNTGRTGNKYR